MEGISIIPDELIYRSIILLDGHYYQQHEEKKLFEKTVSFFIRPNKKMMLLFHFFNSISLVKCIPKTTAILLLFNHLESLLYKKNKIKKRRI